MVLCTGYMSVFPCSRSAEVCRQMFSCSDLEKAFFHLSVKRQRPVPGGVSDNVVSAEKCISQMLQESTVLFCFVVFFRPVIKVECVHTYTIYTINSSAVILLPAFDGFSRPTGSVFCDYVDAMRIVFFSALLYINLPVVLDGTSRMFKESIVQFRGLLTQIQVLEGLWCVKQAPELRSWAAYKKFSLLQLHVGW